MWYFILCQVAWKGENVGTLESMKHGCLKYRTGAYVQITYLRSISSFTVVNTGETGDI